ncbi:MAG: sulfate/molybdate ABC transporter ATP-binding protein [Acidimicrobiia bacterium]
MSLRLDFTVHRGPFSLTVDEIVESGETVAIVGDNGAGKTTLLKCLAGLIAVDSGRIVLDDLVLDDASSDDFVPPECRDVGLVFQDHLLFEHLSALENVAFGPRARGVGRSEARTRARTLLESVGLHGFADRRPSELSGGQHQRVALLRALAVSPRLLLLDEPLSAIDANARADLRASLVERIAAFHGTTLVVSHDPADVVALAGRVIVLTAGRVTWDGPVGDDGWHR